jgi:hypothetical protein
VDRLDAKNAFESEMKSFLLATAMVLMVAPAANAGETYSYACEVKEDVDGHVVKGENYRRKFLHLLQIKDHTLIWRGKNYHIVNQPACAKSGWHATGHGMTESTKQAGWDRWWARNWQIE